jgi:hypothetical protein
MNREPKQKIPENTKFPMDQINEKVRRSFGRHAAVIYGGFDFISPPNSEPIDVEKTADAHRALLRLLDAENNIDK